MNESQALFGDASERVKNKVRPYMVDWVKNYISYSPFLVLATCNSLGECDASPRGGKPGFVKVLDSTHLIMPDVSGNKLFQSFENIKSNPNVGLVFFLPGENSTVRVNGVAKVIQKGDEKFDSLTLSVFSPEENRTLIQAIEVTVIQSYSHCPRALSYSKLWNCDEIKNNIENPKISRWKPGT